MMERMARQTQLVKQQVTRRNSNGTVSTFTQGFHKSVDGSSNKAGASRAAEAGLQDDPWAGVPSPWDPERIQELLDEWNEKYAPNEFVFETRSDMMGEDKGISCDLFTVKRDGKTVAYLKASYVNDATLRERCPTVYHVMSEYEGVSLGLYEYNNDDQYGRKHIKPWTPELREETLKYLEERRYSRRDIPKEDDYDKMIEDRVGQLRYPFVDFIRVDENHRGERIPDQLYELAANVYGGLRASGVQSDDGKRLWERYKTQNHPMYHEWEDERFVDYHTGEPRQLRAFVTDWDRFNSISFQPPGDPHPNASSRRRQILPRG